MVSVPQAVVAALAVVIATAAAFAVALFVADGMVDSAVAVI